MSKFTAKNAVVWVWPVTFENDNPCDIAPEELQAYFDHDYIIKEVHTTTYKQDKPPIYMFILEKDKQKGTSNIKFKTN